MKRVVFILLVLALLILSASTVSAGTVVIVGPENAQAAGGVGPTSPSDGGGSYYCGNPGTVNVATIWVLNGLFQCQEHAHYNWAAYWTPQFGWIGGNGLHFYVGPHYHCIWNC